MVCMKGRPIEEVADYLMQTQLVLVLGGTLPGDGIDGLWDLPRSGWPLM